MSRAVSLLPEACMAASCLTGFGALVTGGARAGRVAHRAAAIGAALALVAAVTTWRADDEWLFVAYRVDLVSQIAKAAVCAGLLVAAFLERRAPDPWSGARSAGPLFRLVAGLALCAAASASDLLVTWLAVETAAFALVLAVAAEGRWSSTEKFVRRLLGSVLPTALLIGLGAVLMAAAAGSTRYVDLASAPGVVYARPAFALGASLAVWSLVARLVLVTQRLRTARAEGRLVQSFPEIALLAGALAAVLRLMALVSGIPLP